MSYGAIDSTLHIIIMNETHNNNTAPHRSTNTIQTSYHVLTFSPLPNLHKNARIQIYPNVLLASLGFHAIALNRQDAVRSEEEVQLPTNIT